MTDIVDSAELANFREQWKAEVQQRTRPQTTRQPEVSQSLGTSSSYSPIARSEGSEQSDVSRAIPVVTPAYTREHYSGNTSSHTSRSLKSAIETYRLAVQLEQSGDLDEALRLYRHAFRLDSHVDKAYRKEELRLTVQTALGQHGASENRKRASLDAAITGLDKDLAHLSLPSKATVTGNLATIVANFPPDIAFEPEDEREGLPIRQLPDELLVHILSMLDPTSIERFAVIDKKARVLSLDSGIWRHLVQKTYLPPQVPKELGIDTVAEQFMSDYRRLYVEYPRLRLDGVYIAVCHYIRPGLSENAWVHVSHLITYHRYLRFLPDGTVLSLLANEEVEPHTVIPLLKPSLRMKGLCIGNWSLLGSTVYCTDLTDPSGRNSRYTFQMTLTLRSRPLGRWNKLDFAGYESVNAESGEAIPLALKHERPFWFSKVRSYTY